MLFGMAAASGGVVLAPQLVSAAAPAAAPNVMYGPPASVAKLNANENPFGPSPGAIRAIQESASRGAYYVGDLVQTLREMIAERNGVKPNQIAISSGSSGILTYLSVAKAQHGAILAPDLYWDTTTLKAVNQGGELVRMPKDPGLAIDLATMEKMVTDEISLVHITNPNNPTGMTLDSGELRAFCKRVSKKATVLVDEAYNELTADPEGSSMVDLVREGYDVVVARTFSKIYGLAGMRIGYMIGPEEAIDALEVYGIGDYAMNIAGVAAAIASYNDFAFLAESKERILEARGAIEEAVASAGLKSLPSETNFLFVDLGNSDAEKFRAAMAKRNVLIRGIYRDYTNWSRVSMGTPKDVGRYIAALAPSLEEVIA